MTLFLGCGTGGRLGSAAAIINHVSYSVLTKSIAVLMGSDISVFVKP